jgi:hypothetical protein
MNGIGVESVDVLSSTYNFRKIDWGNNHRLSDTETGDEAPSIYSSKAAVVSQKDGNSKNP